jgi:cold shock CspA family protein
MAMQNSNLISGLLANVKWFNMEKSFGFFQVSGFPDIYINENKLWQQGFEPADMVAGAEVSLDVEIVEGRLSLVRIERIGGKLAQLQAPKAPAVVTPQAAPAMVVPEYDIGDIIVATCIFGFDSAKPDYGVFQAQAGGTKVFVHADCVIPAVFNRIWDTKGLLVEVELTGYNTRGLVGRIDRVYIAPKRQTYVEVQKKTDVDMEEKLRAKKARQQSLLGREKITVVAKDGGVFYGVPVNEQEWPSVPDGTSVILVEGYDSVTGHAAILLESFVVKKQGGKPTKYNRKVDIDFLEKEVEKEAEVVQSTKPITSIGTGLFLTNDGQNVTALIYAPANKGELEQIARVITSIQDRQIAILEKKNGKAEYHLGVVTQGRLVRVPATHLQTFKAAA